MGILIVHIVEKRILAKDFCVAFKG